jgi:hypothetical protein
MKKTALLIDGGWFSKGLGKILNLPNGWPSAAQVVNNATAALQKDEELFRIFYYDCEPFDREVSNPVDGSKINYKAMPTETISASRNASSVDSCVRLSAK